MTGSFFSYDELSVMKRHMAEAVECAELARKNKQVAFFLEKTQDTCNNIDQY